MYRKNKSLIVKYPDLATKFLNSRKPPAGQRNKVFFRPPDLRKNHSLVVFLRVQTCRVSYFRNFLWKIASFFAL